MRSNRLAFGVFAILLATASTARAIDTNWTNAAGGLWTEGLNWDNGAPGATDNAFINLAGPYTVDLRGQQTVTDLTIGDSDATLWIHGANTGDHARLTLAGAGTNSGVIQMQSANQNWQSNLNCGPIGLTNNGAIHVNVGTGGPREIDGTLIHAGTIEVESGTVARIIGAFDLAGGTIGGGGETRFDSCDISNSASPATLQTLIAIGDNTLQTDLLANAELWIRGANTGGIANVTTAGAISNSGRIRLQSINQDWQSNLTLGGVLTNNADGVIEAVLGNGGPRRVTGDIDNFGDIIADATVCEILGVDPVVNQNAGTMLPAFTAGEIRVFGAAFNYNGGAVDDGVLVTGASTLTVAGTVTTPGSISTGSDAVTLVNNLSDVVTVRVLGRNFGGNSILTLADGGANAGTIRLDTINTNWSSQLMIPGTFTNESTGSIEARLGTGGARLIQGGTLVHRGFIDVEAGVLLSYFGTFEEDGGEIGSGGGLFFLDDCVIRVTGSPAQPTTLTLVDEANTLETDVLPQVELWVRGRNVTGVAALSTAGPVANSGRIRLQSTDSNWSESLNLGDTLTNNADGVIDIQNGTGGARTINGNIDNAGTINLNGTLLNIAGADPVFNQNGGTVLPAAGASELRFNSGTFNFNGGQIDEGLSVIGTSTLTIADTVTIPSTITTSTTQVTLTENASMVTTVRVLGRNGLGTAFLTLADGGANAGAIDLTAINSNWTSQLILAGAFTNESTGRIRARAGTGGARFIQGGVLTHQGLISVEPGVQLTYNGTFEEDGGRVNGDGSLFLDNCVIRVTGSPPEPTTLMVIRSLNTLETGVAANVELWLHGRNVSGHCELTTTGPINNNGVLRLESSHTNWSEFVHLGGLLTNTPNGLIHCALGTGGNRVFNGDIRNQGTIRASITTVINGLLTSLVGDVLTEGTYDLSAALRFDGVPVVTNSARLLLTGPAAGMTSLSSANLLGGLAANTASGDLALRAGKALTTTAALANAGDVEIDNSTMTVNGGDYTQTNGTTTMTDGTLAAVGDVVVAGGIASLDGAVNANELRIDSAQLNVGASAGQIVASNDYTQSATGILNIEIGGLTAGAEFDQIVAAGDATLAGTLNVSLINGYTPEIGDSFEIIASANRVGMFSVENLLADWCNGRGFAVEYTATSVIVTVVPTAPCPLSGDLDQDGGCDVDDVMPFVNLLLGVGDTYNPCGDFNEDCRIDGDDIQSFLECLF